MLSSPERARRLRQLRSRTTLRPDLFFAAMRYHGFYSSPDGLTWTRLANQPGAAGLLSTNACPQNYSTSCPIYRGEITVVPGRNEMTSGLFQ